MRPGLAVLRERLVVGVGLRARHKEKDVPERRLRELGPADRMPARNLGQVSLGGLGPQPRRLIAHGGGDEGVEQPGLVLALRQRLGVPLDADA